MKITLHTHNGDDHIIKRFSFPEQDNIVLGIKKLNDKAITSRIELESFIQGHKKRGNYIELGNKMNRLGIGLAKAHTGRVDPIVFLIKLYYKEGLSTRDIILRIQELGVNIPRNTFTNMMTNIFGWTLRGKHESTRMPLKNRKNVAEFNELRTLKVSEATKELVAIIMLSDLKPFNLEECNKCKNLSERVAYIFSLYSVALNMEDSKKYVRALNKGGISMSSIAMIISELFKNAIPSGALVKIPKIDSSRINKMYFRA